MCPLTSVIGSFAELRKRHVHEPVYCRLIIPAPLNRRIGWLWRDPSRARHPLQTGETFVLSLPNSSEVRITWQPLFEAKLEGEPGACDEAIWFLNKHPIVSGGSHLSLDDFEMGPASWNRAASDFFLVRCGSYEHKGEQKWRHPSIEALDWVRSNLFRVNPYIRKRVIEAMEYPLPSGENMTIRRVFEHEELARQLVKTE